MAGFGGSLTAGLRGGSGTSVSAATGGVAGGSVTSARGSGSITASASGGNIVMLVGAGWVADIVLFEGFRLDLEGSVQRSGDQVRVNTRLIKAETDAHLWAGRFDRDMGDLFALQNEITGRIAIALDVALIGAEATRPTDHPDALDYIFRGRAALLKPLSRERYAEGISSFEHALMLDPRSVEGQSRLASALVGRVLDEMSASSVDDIAHAEGLIGQALAASPLSPIAHFAKGQLLRARGRCDEAISEYETALASNRNWASAIANIGRCKIYVGPIEEASLLEEQAIRLSPLDPQIGVWYFRIGQAHLVQSRIDEAIVWFEKARSANRTLAGGFRGASDPRPVRNHLSRGSAQGRSTGGVSATAVAS
jgi:adenylate cyclase